MLSMAAGFTMAVLSAICYGTSAVLTKMVSDRGVSVSSILLFRGVIGGILLAGISRVCGHRTLKLGTGMGQKAIILSLLGSGATLLVLNKAYLYLPVGSVTTIHYLFPAAVNTIDAYLSGKPLNMTTRIVLFVCTAGTLLLFESLIYAQLPGVVYALISIGTWSFQILYLEHSGLTECPAISVAVWQCAAVAVIGLLCGFAEGQTLGLAVDNLPLLVPAAILNNIFANILFQKGVKCIGGGLAAILCIFEPISSIVLGYVILGESMTLRQSAAVMLILTAIGILIVRNSIGERNAA